jgi:hypothetical protein
MWFWLWLQFNQNSLWFHEVLALTSIQPEQCEVPCGSGFGFNSIRTVCGFMRFWLWLQYNQNSVRFHEVLALASIQFNQNSFWFHEVLALTSIQSEQCEAPCGSGFGFTLNTFCGSLAGI